MKITAAIATAPNTDFQICELDLDEPQADEILVKIKAVGLCHTDLSSRDQLLPHPLPAVFGHEGAGVIQKVGTEVQGIQVGDHVVLSFSYCGECHNCHKQVPSNCDQMNALNSSGGRRDGQSALSLNGDPIASHYFGQSSFATHAITTPNNVVVIDKDIPFEIAAPLGCGGQTGIGTIINSLKVHPSDVVMITGGGSVGLYAVMAAKMLGCETIIVSEPLETRRNLALEVGATHVIDPVNEDVTRRIREISPRGADAIVEATGVPEVLSQSYNWVAHGGKIAIVGIPRAMDAPHPGSTMMTLGMGLSLLGVLEGNSQPQTFIPEILSAYTSGKIPLDKIISTYDFKDINTAFQDQHAGISTKAVLIMNEA